MPLKDPEARREYERQRRERIKSDPDLLERRREQNRRGQRKQRQLHPNRVKATQRRYHRANPGKAREAILRRDYGIGISDYDKMEEAQGGLCAICGSAETTNDPRTGKVRRLAVDHDKKTGCVRGLLCRRCNTAIGLLDHDSNRLNRAVEYLEVSRCAEG